jgi:hypothetical protein
VIERVDLGPCRAYDYEGDGPTAVVLPGAMLGGMPAVYYAMEPLLSRGWRVLLVWWEVLDRSVDPWAWVRERAVAAIDFAGGADLLIAKSIGTYAAPIDIPAVWLTPILTETDVVDALRARRARSLFVGGPNDFAWNRELAQELGEAVEIAGADHGLAKIDDAPRIAAAVEAFSVSLGGSRA